MQTPFHYEYCARFAAMTSNPPTPAEIAAAIAELATLQATVATLQGALTTAQAAQ
jgi:hypothetical protein